MSTSIDIVIPCAGRVADLLRLLASLHDSCAHTLPAQVASITVTDDRPSDELRETVAARHPGVRYVHGPARGPASNRNHGARQGSAPWILFLDDDCYLGSDLLQAYQNVIDAAPDTDVLEGAIHPIGERPNGNHHAPLNLHGGNLWSCNLMLRRKLFESVGGFDEVFPFACMEDVDLRERLLSAGVRSRFAAEAKVFHPWRSVSEREITRQIISHAIYADKHRGLSRHWTALNLLRMLLGRCRLYGSGRFASIPWSKYRTVGFDLVAPIAICAVVRVPPLRRVLAKRYRNRLPVTESPGLLSLR